MPTGVTDGHVLTADSTDPAGQVWAAPTGGAGDPIDESIVDAKGDLLAGTAADTIARLAVGANGTILVADSVEATGLKWSTAPGGGLAVTIIDAKGDLIVGSAADTAARLAVGTNGDILTADSAEALGVKWASGGSATPGDACSAYATSAQSLSATTHTAINLDAELFDSSTMHDNATNNTRITIGDAGIYSVAWMGGTVAAAGAYVLLGAVRVNGDQTIRYAEGQSNPVAGSPGRTGGSAVIALAATDYIELVMWQSTAGSVNTEVNANPIRRPMLQAAFLRTTI